MTTDSVIDFLGDLVASDRAALPREHGSSPLAEVDGHDLLRLWLIIGEGPEPPEGVDLALAVIFDEASDDAALRMLETIGRLGTVGRLDVAIGADVPVHAARRIARAARRLRPCHVQVVIVESSQPESG